MTDQIVPSQSVSGSLTVRTMEDLSRLSTMLAKSNFFSDAKDAAQCGVKVLAGLELGIPAFAAMTGIHIIKGKPSLSANVMAAVVKRSGRYDYKVRNISPTECKIEFFEKSPSGWESIGISEMDIDTAKASNLDKEWDKETSKWKEKYNWKTFPRNMLFARAMSNGVRWFCPDVFFGAPIYTPEELGAETNEQGEVIDVPVVQANCPLVDKQATPDFSSLIEQTSAELKRLGWSSQQGKEYLIQTYGKRSRQLLTDGELQDFLNRLRAMEAEEEEYVEVVVE